VKAHRQVAKHILPYVSVKGDLMIQFHFALICLMMLLERMAMILRPLYSKWIGNAIIPGNTLKYEKSFWKKYPLHILYTVLIVF
jgi:hypothetical protein